MIMCASNYIKTISSNVCNDFYVKISGLLLFRKHSFKDIYFVETE